MRISDGEYFMWEDTGKELIRELINFKFRIHQAIPIPIRDRVFSELDFAVETALTRALNFEQVEEYNKMNETYREYAND